MEHSTTPSYTLHYHIVSDLTWTDGNENSCVIPVNDKNCGNYGSFPECLHISRPRIYSTSIAETFAYFFNSRNF